MNEMLSFWNKVNKALFNYDTILVVEDESGRFRISNLCYGGYLRILAHEVEYRSLPVGHHGEIHWISWEPYFRVTHFSHFTDPNATIEWVPIPPVPAGGKVVEVIPK